MINRVERRLLNDCQNKVAELASECGVSNGSFYILIHEHLGMSIVQWRSSASCPHQRTSFALPSHAYCRCRPRGCLRKQREVVLANQTREAYATFPRYLRCFFNQWTACKFTAVPLEWICHSCRIKSTNQICVGVCAGDWYPLPFPLPMKDGDHIIFDKIFSDP